MTHDDLSSDPPPPSRGRRTRRRVALYVAGSIASGILIALATAPLDQLPTLVEATEWLRALQNEWWTPLAFIGLFVLLGALMIPPLPLSAVAAVIWGWKVGAVWDLIAATLASIIPYYTARLLISGWVLRRVAPRFPMVFKRLGTDPFSAVFLLRVVGVVPFVALNYLAGAARIRLLPYLAGTILGLLPPTLVFFYLIDSVTEGMLSREGAALRVGIAGTLTAGLYLAGRYVAKRLAQRE